MVKRESLVLQAIPSIRCGFVSLPGELVGRSLGERAELRIPSKGEGPFVPDPRGDRFDSIPGRSKPAKPDEPVQGFSGRIEEVLEADLHRLVLTPGDPLTRFGQILLPKREPAFETRAPDRIGETVPFRADKKAKRPPGRLIAAEFEKSMMAAAKTLGDVDPMPDNMDDAGFRKEIEPERRGPGVPRILPPPGEPQMVESPSKEIVIPSEIGDEPRGMKQAFDVPPSEFPDFSMFEEVPHRSGMIRPKCAKHA